MIFNTQLWTVVVNHCLMCWKWNNRELHRIIDLLLHAVCYDHAFSDPFLALSSPRPDSSLVYGHYIQSTFQMWLVCPACVRPTHCCIRLVPLTHALWGFRNEGLLSVPQIKHMTYATMLPSHCSYCLSLHLLSLTYFLPHSSYLHI
jgi:hypothetical protein